MFYVTSEIYLNNDLGSLAVSVDNYPQKRKNHLTITYIYYKARGLKYLLANYGIHVPSSVYFISYIGHNIYCLPYILNAVSIVVRVYDI